MQIVLIIINAIVIKIIRKDEEASSGNLGKNVYMNFDKFRFRCDEKYVKT